MAATRLALCALLLGGCLTEPLLKAAKPVERYAPRESRDVEVESAVVTSSGSLDLCVTVRKGDALRYTVEAARPTPERAAQLVQEVNGR